MRSYLRSNKWSMTPLLLAQYSAGTMAPETAKKYARQVAEQEMPNRLSKYVTEEIFPRFGTRIQGGIKPRTAQRWTRREGFRYMKHQKGIYVDGHERPDVVEYRQKVLSPRFDRINLGWLNTRLETALKKLPRRQLTSDHLRFCFMMNRPFKHMMPRRSLGSWTHSTNPARRGWSGHTSLRLHWPDRRLVQGGRGANKVWAES
jgi:hypothetical protein